MDGKHGLVSSIDNFSIRIFKNLRKIEDHERVKDLKFDRFEFSQFSKGIISNSSKTMKGLRIYW